MTITETEALEAMLTHHRTLEENVKARATAIARAEDAGTAYGPEAAELVAYLAGEVLPHAFAEEHSIYQVAAARSDLASAVAEMTVEHRRLAWAVESLAECSNGSEATVQAAQIAGLFGAHVAKENEILLPRLLEDPDVDLVQLLVQMHHLTEAAQEEHPSADDISTPDPEAVVVSLLLEAADDLSAVGRADQGCRLAASAWAVLRVSRPELAARITAALHRLANQKTEEPVTFRSTTDGRAPSDAITEADPDLDVRALAPAQRHESIFAAYGDLTPGSAFVLVNDHDPKPLRYQFEAEHEGAFTWDVLESGPEVWRVRIGRPAIATGQQGGARETESGEESELDVRALAHWQRHESIFAAYDELTSGEAFVLANDHDPKPLRYQFEAQHPGEFTWGYLESGPEVWRVRIGKVAI